jgi:hypothetical protein
MMQRPHMKFPDAEPHGPSSLWRRSVVVDIIIDSRVFVPSARTTYTLARVKDTCE